MRLSDYVVSLHPYKKAHVCSSGLIFICSEAESSQTGLNNVYGEVILWNEVAEVVIYCIGEHSKEDGKPKDYAMEKNTYKY